MADKSGNAKKIRELEERVCHLEGEHGEQRDYVGGGGGNEPGRGFCSMPIVPERELSAGVDGDRARLIRVTETKWVNGTELKYYFFDRSTDGETVFFNDGTSEFRTWTGAEEQKAVVRDGFDVWTAVGIGIRFKEVNAREDADIRIGFMRGDGAWSYLGRQIRDRGVNERTMNFGWDLTRAGEVDTAVHEIGHTLGFPHEHQNPNAGIVWDEEAVYAALAAPPNEWSRATTHWNIIRKIEPDTVQGSNWDPDSIMHYPFGRGLIVEPSRYKTQDLQPAPGLSARDEAQVKFFYPPLESANPELRPFQPKMLDIAPGQQLNFSIVPDATRPYTIRTFGESDTVMVLFEDNGGELVFVAGDDDSGTDLNANLALRLFKGRKYVLRLRLYYATASGSSAVMLW